MVFSGALFALVALASTAISSPSRSFQRRDASSALQGANAIGFSVAYSVCEISLQAFAVAALLGDVRVVPACAAFFNPTANPTVQAPVTITAAGSTFTQAAQAVTLSGSLTTITQPASTVTDSETSTTVSTATQSFTSTTTTTQSASTATVTTTTSTTTSTTATGTYTTITATSISTTVTTTTTTLGPSSITGYVGFTYTDQTATTYFYPTRYDASHLLPYPTATGSAAQFTLPAALGAECKNLPSGTFDITGAFYEGQMYLGIKTGAQYPEGILSEESTETPGVTNVWSMSCSGDVTVNSPLQYTFAGHPADSVAYCAETESGQAHYVTLPPSSGVCSDQSAYSRPINAFFVPLHPVSFNAQA